MQDRASTKPILLENCVTNLYYSWVTVLIMFVFLWIHFIVFFHQFTRIQITFINFSFSSMFSKHCDLCSSGLAFQVHSCVAVKLLFYSWGNFLYRCWFRSNEIDAGAVHLTYLIDHESFWVCAHADRLTCCSNVPKYNRWSAFAAREFWDKSWKYIVPHLLQRR